MENTNQAADKFSHQHQSSYLWAERFDRNILSLSGSLDGYQNTLQMSESGTLKQVYAPFDYLEQDAEIAIVGITPGDYQTRVSMNSYRTSRIANKSILESLSIAKRTASFSGPIRTNLVRILDHAGLNASLRITSTNRIFHEGQRLAHFTSLLRYPIFKNGENYSGTPKPTKDAYLWSLVQDTFVKEFKSLNCKLWIPLGAVVQDAFRKLVADGEMKASSVLFGLPHPSGANMGRIKAYLNSEYTNPLKEKL